MKVSIIIPTLYKRTDGLLRLIKSIRELNYPKEEIETILVHGRNGLPKALWEGYQKSNGQYIIFAADDTEFTPDSVNIVIKDSIDNKKGLVAFDTGVLNEEGYSNEHFMITKDLVEQIGEIFNTDFHHIALDDYLWKKCLKLNEAMMSKAKLNHYHFSRNKDVPFDETYQMAWSKSDEDRALLKQKLEVLNNE